MRHWLVVLSALIAAALIAGCAADLGTERRTVSNEYTGGSIPPGKGPVTAAGYVVDAMNGRAPIEGSEVTISSTGDPSAVFETTTDEDGFFYVDEIEHGYVTITTEGPDTYQSISCVVNATVASVITCSIATYTATAIPLLPTGLDLGDTITGMPETIGDGETIYPGALVANGRYADFLTFAVAINRAVVNRDGSITGVQAGSFVLNGLYKAKKPKKAAKVAE